jgi:hypothetical protein
MDRFIEVVCSLPPSAARHVFHNDGGISRNILLEERNNGFGSKVPDPAGRAALNDGKGFSLEERTLRESHAVAKETEQ